VIRMEGSVSWQYGDYAPAADPDAALHLSLRILEDRIKDWSDVFEKVAAGVLQPEVSANIGSEGEQLNALWPELMSSTVQERERLGFGGEHPILIRDGNLLRSFSTGDSNHIQDVGPNEMSWGSLLPYSLFHQTGTSGGYIGHSYLERLGFQIKRHYGAYEPVTGIGMPARPIIRMTEELQDKIRRKFMRAVFETGKAAHFQTLWEGREDIGEGEGVGGGMEEYGQEVETSPAAQTWAREVFSKKKVALRDKFQGHSRKDYMRP
jgi:phage gpG-like protein